VLHLSTHGFVGANVTIPHKERALILSKPDARARAVGAANTLWYEGDELRSTNTDIEGFINNLDACAPGWDAASDALVLGAGGSARAVVFGLIERGIKRVHLANRTPERARALADQFGASVDPVSWDATGELLRARLAGSTRHRSACTASAAQGRRRPASAACRCRRPRICAAADALLSAARARGLKTADGLGMLLHQAVRGFELCSDSALRLPPKLRDLSKPISQKFEPEHR